MKSIPQGAGNLKMKGKKTCQMNCGCCVAVNFKDEIVEDFMDDEIYEFEKEEIEGEEIIYNLSFTDDPNDAFPQEPWAW